MEQVKACKEAAAAELQTAKSKVREREEREKESESSLKEPWRCGAGSEQAHRHTQAAPREVGSPCGGK